MFFSVACEKDLKITDFKDEFKDYKSEIKIEGLLQVDNPSKSIIRIIKTMPIIESDVYNGKDDDFDNEIDELDEVIPMVQDTSATVYVKNLDSGEKHEFVFKAVADSFEYWGEEFDEDLKIIKFGGYMPKSPDFKLTLYTRYEMEVYSKQFDQTIRGETRTYPPVEFIDTLFTYQDSLVTMKIDDEREIFWKSDNEISAYYIYYQGVRYIDDGSNDGYFEFSEKGYHHITSRDYDLTKKYSNASVGREVILDVESEDILKITIQALSPEYGHYVFSDLPTNDPQRSNLTDNNGNSVMGCFGATTANSVYVIILDEDD